MRIKAPTTSERLVAGTIVSVTDKDILILSKDLHYYLLFDSVEQLDLSIQRKRRPLKGLAIGALTMGTFIGGVSALTYTECVPKSLFDCIMHPQNRGSAFVLGAIGGGLLGGFAGLIIGSFTFTDTWENISITPGIRPVSDFSHKTTLSPSVSLQLKLKWKKIIV